MEIKLNFHQFNPEEISVRLLDNYLVVEGSHASDDCHDSFSYEFSRRYNLPDDVQRDGVHCQFGPHGILHVFMPRGRSSESEGEEKEHRNIKIGHAWSPRGVPVLPKTLDKFEVKLDVQHFAPHELKVTLVNDDLVVEAAHEYKADEHGDIARNFVRRYKVPPQLRTDDVICILRGDGILHVMIPKYDGDIGKPLPIFCNSNGLYKPQTQ